jgi:23S rRNA (uridine2479-2'-O)-methyltransferase
VGTVAIRSADDRYQVLSSLLTTRAKRHRRRAFIVQGVRQIDAALAAGWPLEAVAWRRGRHLSQWASGIVERAEVADRYELEPSLMAGLSGKDDPAELVLVAKIPVRRLSDTPVGPDTVACVLDRIASPGNLGSVVRSADALGAGVVVTVGHGADPYDPVCVRASTGSLFVVPVVSTSSIEEVVSWCAVGDGVQLVGADEQGQPSGPGDLGPPVALVLGSEGRGLSRAARDACARTVAIPMAGRAATSLNVAVAAGILLHLVGR